MRKYTNAIRKIRQTIKDLAEEKPKMRAEVRSLKFNANEERRPETGPQRCALKESYDWRVRPEIRANLLAYGILRGKAYKTMEAKCVEPIEYVIPRVLRAIHEAIGDDAELKAEWYLERVRKIILQGEDIPAPAPEVAA